jgi:integrase
MLILTMQRRQEVAEMDWSEIDLEERTWTLPAERAKNNEAHIIPLTDLAVAELYALGPKEQGLVFTTTGRTPPSGYSKAKQTLGQDMNVILRYLRRKKSRSRVTANIVDWRFHDLRRTGATNLQALGIPIEVTEAVLNHISGTRAGVAGIYNRYKYEPEKRNALDAWDNKLKSIFDEFLSSAAADGLAIESADVL